MSVPERPELRVGDEVRNRVVDDLRIHFAAGRLNLTEFEERTTAALAAVTVADLQPLLRDLPDARLPVRQSGPPIRQPAPKVRPTDAWDVLYRIHVGIWVVLSVFFVLLAAVTTSGIWPIYPILGIGLSVGIHGAVKRGIQG